MPFIIPWALSTLALIKIVFWVLKSKLVTRTPMLDSLNQKVSLKTVPKPINKLLVIK